MTSHLKLLLKCSHIHPPVFYVYNYVIFQVVEMSGFLFVIKRLVIKLTLHYYEHTSSTKSK